MEKQDELIFSEIDVEEKKILLDALGFSFNENGFIIERENKKEVKCPFSGTSINLKNASILPGSTIVINTNALTLSEYLHKYYNY